MLISTPWFNYMDFLVDLIDYAYEKGHVSDGVLGKGIQMMWESCVWVMKVSGLDDCECNISSEIL